MAPFVPIARVYQLESSMQIAITGATGFVGRYLVRRLAGAGHRFRCWFRDGSDRGGFEREAGSIEWLSGELGDASASRSLVQGVDALVHAAVQEGPRNRGQRQSRWIRRLLRLGAQLSSYRPTFSGRRIDPSGLFSALSVTRWCTGTR